MKNRDTYTCLFMPEDFLVVSLLCPEVDMMKKCALARTQKGAHTIWKNIRGDFKWSLNYSTWNFLEYIYFTWTKMNAWTQSSIFLNGTVLQYELLLLLLSLNWLLNEIQFKCIVSLILSTIYVFRQHFNKNCSNHKYVYAAVCIATQCPVFETKK